MEKLLSMSRTLLMISYFLRLSVFIIEKMHKWHRDLSKAGRGGRPCSVDVLMAKSVIDRLNLGWEKYQVLENAK